MATAAKPEPVEVVLAKPHTHNGRAHPAGDTIKVTADQKAWLEKLGVVGKQEEVNHG